MVVRRGGGSEDGKGSFVFSAPSENARRMSTRQKLEISYGVARAGDYSLSLLEGTKTSGFGRLMGGLFSDFSLNRWGLSRPLLPSFQTPRSAISDRRLLSPVQLRCLRPHSLNPPVFLSLDEDCPIAKGSLALDPRVRLKKIRTARRRHNCTTPRRFSRII
jgi:hypothetical protein